MLHITRRAIGYCIDLVISFLFYLLFFILLAKLLSLLHMPHSFSIALKDYLNNLTHFQDQFFTWVAFFIFLLLQDLSANNYSVSRRLLNLKLVNDKDITYPGFKQLVVRNLIKAVFFLDVLYYVFFRKMFHDKISKSKIIKI